MFEPGEGWCYGASIEWTGALTSRLLKQPLGKYIEKEILEPLSISLTYEPQNRPDVTGRLLQMVERQGDVLIHAEGHVYGLVTSVPDLCTLFADLMSHESKVLGNKMRDLFFEGQFGEGSKARECLRGDTENYAAPVGIPRNMKDVPVDRSLGALVVDGILPLSDMPA